MTEPVNVPPVSFRNVLLTYELEAAYATALEYAVPAFVVASDAATDTAFE